MKQLFLGLSVGLIFSYSNVFSGIHQDHEIYPANWDFVGSLTADLVAKGEHGYSDNDVSVIQNVIRRVARFGSLGSTGTSFFNTCNTNLTVLHNTHNAKGQGISYKKPTLFFYRYNYNKATNIKISINDSQLNQNLTYNADRSDDYIYLNLSHPYPEQQATCNVSYKMPDRVANNLLSGQERPSKCFLVAYNKDNYLKDGKTKDKKKGYGIYLRTPGQEQLKFYNYYDDTRHISFCSVEKISDGSILHRCDSIGGASGSPLICKFSDGKWYQAGVHANHEGNSSQVNNTKILKSQRESENFATIPL